MSWSKERRIDAAGHAHEACESWKFPAEMVPPGLSEKTRKMQFWGDFASENPKWLSKRTIIDSGRRGRKEKRRMGNGKRGFKCGGQVISNVTRDKVTC